jgi:hypothetical protein
MQVVFVNQVEVIEADDHYIINAGCQTRIAHTPDEVCTILKSLVDDYVIPRIRSPKYGPEEETAPSPGFLRRPGPPHPTQEAAAEQGTKALFGQDQEVGSQASKKI